MAGSAMKAPAGLQDLMEALRCLPGVGPRSAQRHGSPERGPRGPAKRGSGSGGDARARQSVHGATAARYGVASSFGRHCSALRGLARFYRNPYGAGLCERSALSGSWRRGSTIRAVAFRASHPAKPPPRQWRFIQRFPKRFPASQGRRKYGYPPLLNGYRE